ncbi:MAG: T9SS type A sorting domain-containing protein [Candidatus Aegiribacteria sp.]|nr:T9SS type A sorting domain-containing protein [Candidatus Aegiribacteria sp.]
MVSEIYEDEYSPGFHDVLHGELTPGIYFCRMISGDFTATQRFVVIE